MFPLPGAGFIEGQGYDQLPESLGAFKEIYS
jgi:hypothetical protein